MYSQTASQPAKQPASQPASQPNRQSHYWMATTSWMLTAYLNEVHLAPDKWTSSSFSIRAIFDENKAIREAIFEVSSIRCHNAEPRDKTINHEILCDTKDIHETYIISVRNANWFLFYTAEQRSEWCNCLLYQCHTFKYQGMLIWRFGWFFPKLLRIRNLDIFFVNVF